MHWYSSQIVTRLRWLNSPYGEVVAAFRAGRRLSFSRRRPRAIARPMLSLLMNRPVVFHAHAASKSQRGSIQQVRDLFVPSSHSDPILTPGWIELNSAGSSDPRGLEIIENWRNYPGGPIQPNSSGGPTGPGWLRGALFLHRTGQTGLRASKAENAVVRRALSCQLSLQLARKHSLGWLLRRRSRFR